MESDSNVPDDIGKPVEAATDIKQSKNETDAEESRKTTDSQEENKLKSENDKEICQHGNEEEEGCGEEEYEDEEYYDEEPEICYKPPSQRLNEIERGLKYELVSEFTDQGEKYFTYTVEIEDEVYEGTASSKQGAKHAAAKNALLTCYNIICKSGKEEELVECLDVPCDAILSCKNPVMQMNELIPGLKYEVVSEEENCYCETNIQVGAWVKGRWFQIGGHTKRGAKINCAKLILKELFNVIFVPESAISKEDAKIGIAAIVKKRNPWFFGEQPQQDQTQGTNAIVNLFRIRPYLEYTHHEKMTGPDNKPSFMVSVEVDGNIYEGVGTSKKKAKLVAAEKALAVVRGYESFKRERPRYTRKQRKLLSQGNSGQNSGKDWRQHSQEGDKRHLKEDNNEVSQEDKNSRSTSSVDDKSIDDSDNKKDDISTIDTKQNDKLFEDDRPRRSNSDSLNRDQDTDRNRDDNREYGRRRDRKQDSDKGGGFGRRGNFQGGRSSDTEHGFERVRGCEQRMGFERGRGSRSERMLKGPHEQRSPSGKGFGSRRRQGFEKGRGFGRDRGYRQGPGKRSYNSDEQSEFGPTPIENPGFNSYAPNSKRGRPDRGGFKGGPNLCQGPRSLIDSPNCGPGPFNSMGGPGSHDAMAYYGPYDDMGGPGSYGPMGWSGTGPVGGHNSGAMPDNMYYNNPAYGSGRNFMQGQNNFYGPEDTYPDHGQNFQAQWQNYNPQGQNYSGLGIDYSYQGKNYTSTQDQTHPGQGQNYQEHTSQNSNFTNQSQGYKVTAQNTTQTSASVTNYSAPAKPYSISAQSYSNTAQNNSNTAQSYSNTAQNNSNTAQSYSNTAQNNSNTAQSYSNTAQNNSNTAQSYSNTAQNNSNTAQSYSNTAQSYTS